jgi:hypothetical protein
VDRKSKPFATDERGKAQMGEKQDLLRSCYRAMNPQERGSGGLAAQFRESPGGIDKVLEAQWLSPFKSRCWSQYDDPICGLNAVTATGNFLKDAVRAGSPKWRAVSNSFAGFEGERGRSLLRVMEHGRIPRCPIQYRPTMMFSACFWFLTVTSVIETAGNRMSRAAFKTHHGDAGKNQGHRVIGKGKPFAADYADECRSKIQPLIFTDDTDLGDRAWSHNIADIGKTASPLGLNSKIFWCSFRLATLKIPRILSTCEVKFLSFDLCNRRQVFLCCA